MNIMMPNEEAPTSMDLKGRKCEVWIRVMDTKSEVWKRVCTIPDMPSASQKPWADEAKTCEVKRYEHGIIELTYP